MFLLFNVLHTQSSLISLDQGNIITLLQYGRKSVLDLNWEFTDVNIQDIKKKKKNQIISVVKNAKSVNFKQIQILYAVLGCV